MGRPEEAFQLRVWIGPLKPVVRPVGVLGAEVGAGVAENVADAIDSPAAFTAVT